MDTRTSPRKRYTLRLLAGALALFVAAVLFGAIAEDVINRDAPLGTLDANVGTWLHAHASPALTSLMLACSAVGAPGTVLTIALVAAALLLWRGQRDAALLLVLAVPGGLLLNLIVKLIVHRARPVFDDPILTLTTYSFPSGHAAGSTQLFGALAVIVAWQLRTWRLRVLALSAAASIVALICFSRIYLGVHFLSDVAAGVLESVAWLGACLVAIEALRQRGAAQRSA